ncbi:MAG TPA: hypothetical protein DCQ36_03385 [Actinobacteria bacterium]|nr:hypothetical protein [Actinomycetota bacterium]
MNPRGWAIALTSALGLAIALWLDWSVLLAVALGLGSILLAALALRRPSVGSWSDLSAPVRVVRGDAAAIEIGVTVPSGSTRWVSAVDAAGVDRRFIPFAGPVGTLTWPLDTSRRGLFPVGPSRLEAGDPFGVSARVLAARTPSPVLVVPRVHTVDARISSGLDEAEEAQERAGSETFHSLREYVVGDPQKLVHWKSSARAGKLMVRRMVDTTVPWLLVVLDVNARAYDREGAMFEDFDSPAFEESVDTAASWAWHGCGADQRVLLATTSLAPASGSGVLAAEVTARTRESALDWLAIVEPVAAENCGPGRVEALLRRQGVGRAVLITGRRTETSAAWVARWRRTAPVSTVVGHR